MILCKVLQEYRVSGLLLCAIWSLYEHKESCVCILGVKSKPLMVGGRHHRGCVFSFVCGFQYTVMVEEVSSTGATCLSFVDDVLHAQWVSGMHY